MARDFNGTTQFASVSAAPVTGTPFTMACWANLDSITTAQTLMCNGTSGSGDNQYQLLVATGSQIVARSRTSVNNDATTSTTISGTGVWFSAMAVFASSTDRRVFLNGGGKGTNAVSNAPSATNKTHIGVRTDGGAQFADGRIGWCAIWNVALTDEEAAAFGARIHPWLIRPSALKAFWPLGLGSPEPEFVAKNELTLTNAPSAVQTIPLIERIPLIIPVVSVAGTDAFVVQTLHTEHGPYASTGGKRIISLGSITEITHIT